tara:strand:+ start:436 stop:552 length:117 start_codon:yes stop_codon:yes gene_type:complete
MFEKQKELNLSTGIGTKTSQTSSHDAGVVKYKEVTPVQ